MARMGKLSKSEGVAVAVVAVLVAIAMYVGLICYLTVENLAFAIIATAVVIGTVGATIAGRFTTDESVWTRLSEFVLRHMLVMVGFLGLTGLGLGLGWATIADRHESAIRAEAAQRAAAAERARLKAAEQAEETRRAEEAARFAAMDSDAHLGAAQQALGNNYNPALGIGGELDEAERHLHAIPADAPQAKTAAELLKTVASRRARALLAEARKVMADNGDVLARADNAEQLLLKVPAGVPEAAEAHSLRTQIVLQRDRAHLDAARKAIAERLFSFAEAQLDKISPNSPEAPTAKKLRFQSTAARRAEQQREAQEEARRRRERERAERAERSANRGLRCCDGSLSPSCSCSGSHRGCCSHHGGVCGCE